MVVTIRIKFGLLLCLVLAIAITNAGISGSKGKAVHHIPHKLQGNIRGRDLRVVTGHFPPYISILRNSSGHITDYSDHMYQHLQYLSQKLEFTYTIFPAAGNSIHDGVKSIDIWSAVIETITNLEADIGLVPATVSLERYESIEFCGFLGGDNTGILVKYPAANISFTSAFDVFSIEVWMWGIISGIAIVTICRIFSYVTKRLRINVDENKPEIRAGTILMYFFGNTFSQGNYFPCQQPSQKLLVATWCFVTFVFVNTYNSTLTSYMSVTYQRPEVNSFRDLALATKYKATVLTGSIQDIDLRVIMKVYVCQYI
ncbi:uncharacterized protein LOC124207942 [Daphnia pulex]|uniref:uncharacterized protein LOC124207942 n=1 Tax=Daphnia pulex TaxID=6669 RepID=UPI001EDD5BA0|nr:uncharacterized protein LOC124207942 [Daphnia pulex]